MRPKPARASPTEAILPRVSNRITAPIPTRGSATTEMLKRSPSSATSHPILVVPRFAPKMTPIDCENVSNPALTNPIVVSTVALEDCMRSVIVTPATTELTRPPVKRARMDRSESPAIALRPSVSRTIPRRNSPTPPRMPAINGLSPQVVVEWQRRRLPERQGMLYGNGLELG